jgi:Na+/H+ antiporter NhaD/arsenite permease-like protein
MESASAAPPLHWILPFAALLGCIALLPLAASHFWESNRNKALVAAFFAVPTAAYLASSDPAGLLHAATEYVSFITLLGSLYVITGGIHVSGDLAATPRNNTLLLAAGGLLANLVGTTGASMVLIRVFLTTNSERRQVGHLPLFFILVVSNCAGLLTPLGDPPLFLGYLRGVPFTWTVSSLWPFWLVAMGYLLFVFYRVDRRAFSRERPIDVALDKARIDPVRVHGKRQIVLLALVIGAIFLPTPAREATMVGLSVLSVVALGSEPRRLNRFAYAPIVEVAVLFVGIFITMVPALSLLQSRGSALGLSHPAHFFLVTGALSSLLDNAPTYLTFLSAAQGMHLADEVVGVPHSYLAAISVGAVFMGANTYIGNGPNFMVKAIADAAGYKTPSFFGYAGQALLLLMPLYGLVLLLLYSLY